MWRIYTKEESSPLENRLDEFLEKNDVRLNNDTDIIEFGSELGFDIGMMPLDEQKLDGVILVENEDKIIAVNEKLDLKKARFVIAHELGHYITQLSEIHKENSNSTKKKQLFFAARDKIYHDKDKPRIEHDMDYLGAAMLVPKNQFIIELISNDVELTKFQNVKSELEIRKNINQNLIDYFADRYNVEADVIIKRIAEVSYYA